MGTKPKKVNHHPSLPDSPHEEIQTEEETFHCSYPNCDYKHGCEDNVSRHEHSHNPFANWRIPCQVCSQIFKSLASFFHHMSSQHSNKLFCPWCLFLGEHSTELKAHMLAHKFRFKSTRQKRSNGTAGFRCGTCFRIFSRNHDLSEHERKNLCNSYSIETAAEKIQELWADCPKALNNPKQMGEFTHIERKVQRPLLSCDKCSYTTTRPRNLRQHYRVHTGERPFKCTNLGCDYSARWVGNLQRHQQHSCRGTKVERQMNIEAKGNGSDTEAQSQTQVNVDTSSSMAFACMLCDFIGDSELSALKHSRQHKTVVISLNRID